MWVVILPSDILFTWVLIQWNFPSLIYCLSFILLLHIVAWAVKDIFFHYERLNSGLGDNKKGFFQLIYTRAIIIYSQFMSTSSELFWWTIRPLFYSILFLQIFHLQPFLYLLSIFCFTCQRVHLLPLPAVSCESRA